MSKQTETVDKNTLKDQYEITVEIGFNSYKTTLKKDTKSKDKLESQYFQQLKRFIDTKSTDTRHRISTKSQSIRSPSMLRNALLKGDLAFDVEGYSEFRSMALMLGMSSGRFGFENYHSTKENKCPNTCKPITRNLLLQMLKLENKYRFSSQLMQKLEIETTQFESSKKLPNAPVFISKVLRDMQEEVVKKFGYTNDDEIYYAVTALRSAKYLYPNDDEIINSVNYLKYNKSKECNFNIGDTIMDCKLYDRMAKQTNSLNGLLHLIDRPLLIIAGSVT